ncbi:cytochrome c oxidase accessory protein CcoG [Herbaspirillum sp. RTI4]|uniref:cytochrome c oxidase accessory protein CcoG n=1 Tax=Herbaspirillum sp. RTI4 TaxID=3048640 RepID=UPI002AB32CA2|nr:cytochrome c oxidase accessory protein CcoG [Herbaspirillum sp. RTI4]MDY7578983.1 cytochrome c oxidase accessory protein CcoG [Herbaspirillum sp. RTI4]MEA9980914.1 cytochrome c oxidase accessory protein CcoG [Herbaspirillum sp. RTI4]
MKTAPDDVAVIKMYASREEIYPREASGRYASLRWLCVWLTQLVFYGLPWLQWNGRQAVLFDLAARKFYIFGIVLWPQDFIYLAVLLIICAYALFLVTAIAGRVWCGFACPQTVYTELFLWIERRIEGTRSARMRLARQPWSIQKIAKKTAKHTAWGTVALWTGISFVGYFTPIRSLLQEAAGLSLGPWEWFWVVFYSFATYGNAGWLREQVCKYMCPYARFQSAMLDKDTLVITYDTARGEPRSSARRVTDAPAKAATVNAAVATAAASPPPGDCIDCSMCVQVCPVGIDIRNGLQYECIGCAACIDACNSVMDKTGAPRGLIRYSSEHAMTEGWSIAQIRRHVMRPRVLIYSGLLLIIISVFFSSLFFRTQVKLDVIRDRGAFGREVEGGMIENVYRLQIMNTSEAPHRYRISVSGIDSIVLATPDEVMLDGASSRAVPVRVQVKRGQGKAGSNKISFVLQADDDPRLHVTESAVFLASKMP